MKKKSIAGTIENGDLVRDQVTGFEGIVVATTNWLNGCVRFLIQSRKLDKDNKPVDQTIDIQQLELLEKKVINTEKSMTGGPIPTPIRIRNTER